jgi:hypothetical protein
MYSYNPTVDINPSKKKLNINNRFVKNILKKNKEKLTEIHVQRAKEQTV